MRMTSKGPSQIGVRLAWREIRSGNIIISSDLIELIRPAAGNQYRVRRDREYSATIPEATATEIARRISCGMGANARPDPAPQHSFHCWHVPTSHF